MKKKPVKYDNGVLVDFESTDKIDAVIAENLVFVSEVTDLPEAVSGVISLAANTTYFFNGTIDLEGSRIVANENTTIIGGSSENCRIKSTGLSGALISSNFSLPMRNITIEANVAIDLDGDGTTTALDWFGVNFTNCATVGTIKDQSNVIFTDCAFLNSGGLTFNGTIGTIAFNSCLFDCNASNTVLILPSTLTVSRRFRVIYSSFVIGTGETGINLNSSTTIPVEGYILDTVNFSGAGTYTTGVAYSDNKSLFVNCRGITNSGNIAQYYMTGNATATIVSSSGVFYKVSGTTSSGAYVEKFTLTNNRATYTGALTGFYKVTAVLSLTSGTNNQIAVRVAKDGTTSAQSQNKTTTNGSGRSENVVCSDIVQLSTNNYIEIFVSNETVSTNITVQDLNVIIERLN